MNDQILALWAVFGSALICGWAGYNYLAGRLDAMSAVIRSQQLVIDHLLDITKADFPTSPSKE